MSITALRTITEASDAPVSLTEAKAQLRVTHNAEDDHIQSLIYAATNWAQVYTRRIFMNTQVGLRMDRFPRSGESAEMQGDPTGQWFYFSPYNGRKKEASKRDKSILLPGGIVTAVNDIDYVDVGGTPQTLTGPTSAVVGTDYQEDLTDDEWAFIYPTATGWPTVEEDTVNSVLIDYQVGWASQLEVPESIRQAIRFKVADLYTIRDTADAGSKMQLISVAENLLDPYVVPHF